MAASSSTIVAPTFTPALQPPPGVISNPDYPDSLKHIPIIILELWLTLITITYGLRAYARAYIRRIWTYEDVLVAIAWVGTVAYCAIYRIGLSHHGGKHAGDITSDEANEAAYWIHVMVIEYGFTICIIKISILCLYRRIFSPIRWNRFDVAILSLIVITTTFYVITCFFKIFECSPREKIWNKSIPGHCFRLNTILSYSGGFNALTDFLILMLPIHAVSKLQMDRRKKIRVVLAFTLGLSGPIFATIGFFVRLQHSTSTDKSWDNYVISLWAGCELTSGTLCVCLPELTAVFRRGNKKPWSNRHHSTGLGDNRKDQVPLTRIPESPMSTDFSVMGVERFNEQA